jgi:2'-5' RNA ligase
MREAYERRQACAVRIFIAAWPPPAITDAIRALSRPDAPRLRWMGESTWHVTLRFLGDVDEADLDTLEARLAPVVRPAEAVAGPATVLLNHSVLAIPVAGLETLASAVVAATGAIGQPPEPRPFRGHITIARTSGRARVPSSLAGERVGGDWRVDEVAIVRSVLGPGGPTYATLRRIAAHA